MSSVMFDGDDKNYIQATGYTVKTDSVKNENNKNSQSKTTSSTVTSSSRAVSSSTESKEHQKISKDFDALEDEARKSIRNNNNERYENTSVNNSRRSSYQEKDLIATVPGETLISRTIEYPDVNTKVIKEVKTLPDGTTVTSTKYETR